eukprot:g10668.t1
MAGPPLAPSSNVNMPKEDKAQEQPSPKRRRKSMDDSNKEDQGHEAPAAAAGRAVTTQDDDAVEAGDAAPAAAAAAAETEPGTGTPDEDGTEQDNVAGGAGPDEATEPGIDEQQQDGEEEEEEEGGDAEGNEGDENQDETDLRGEEIGGSAGPGEGVSDGGWGPEAEEGEGDASSQAGKGEDEAKADGSKIARARSAWMLFLADNREKVRKEHPGLAVGPMQKILSEMWKGLGEEEVARYAKLAEDDKERMKNELSAAGLTKLPTKNSSAASAPGGPTSLVLPLARVRKAVRLDPAVGNISKEGLLLVTKATEVFMTVVADHAWKIGRQTGRKSIRPCDVADFVFAAPEMYWLKDEFREERSSVKKQSKSEASSSKADLGKKATAAAAAMPKGAKPITSFFQKACFVKADTLPPEMAAELTNQHGKTQFSVAEPDLKALTETANKLSASVCDAHEQGAGIVDEEISELFAEVEIEPRKPVEGEAVRAIQGWATIEDDEEVAEALRLDAVDEMAELMAGTQVTPGGDEEEEVEGSDDDNTGPERRAPPDYTELSPHFGVLEAAADESGNAEAAFFLTKAKMAMIAAHSAKGVRQADMREFVAGIE